MLKRGHNKFLRELKKWLQRMLNTLLNSQTFILRTRDTACVQPIDSHKTEKKTGRQCRVTCDTHVSGAWHECVYTMRIARKSEDEPCVVADVIGQYVVCSCNKHHLQLTLVECLTVMWDLRNQRDQQNCS